MNLRCRIYHQSNRSLTLHLHRRTSWEAKDLKLVSAIRDTHVHLAFEVDSDNVISFVNGVDVADVDVDVHVSTTSTSMSTSTLVLSLSSKLTLTSNSTWPWTLTSTLTSLWTTTSTSTRHRRRCRCQRTC